MHAARGRAGTVEERDRARLLRHRYVEQLDAGRLLAGLLRLIGHRHDVVGGAFERIRTHVRLRQVSLHHHLGIARIGDVDAGEILRRTLVRQPDDAAAVLGDRDRHAFAHAAEAAEVVMGERLEIPGDGLTGLGERIACGGHWRLHFLYFLRRAAAGRVGSRRVHDANRGKVRAQSGGEHSKSQMSFTRRCYSFQRSSPTPKSLPATRKGSCGKGSSWAVETGAFARRWPASGIPRAGPCSSRGWP